MPAPPPIILHVTGSTAHARALSGALCHYGFEVWDASTGAAALALAAQDPVLAIVDTDLPDVSAVELLNTLRNDPSTAAIPVVMLLSESSAGSGSPAAAQHRAEAYLKRPVSSRDLALLIHEILRGKELEKAVRDSEERYETLLRSVRRVCEIAGGRISTPLQRVDFAEVVEHAAGVCRPFLNRARQRLALMVLDAPLWVEIDPAGMEQVVCTLVRHASSLSSVGSQIWVTVESAENEVTLRVRDAGVGIPETRVSSVFDPPTVDDDGPDSAARSRGGPLHSSGVARSAGSSDGFGTGLFMVRNIVELNGGAVAAHSGGSAMGSEYTISLPRADDTAAADAPDGAETPARPIQILVVDDNANVTETLASLLGRWGYNVYSASDGATALALADRCHPDVVLLDIGMPGMDGYEVAAKLRSNPETAGARIVAITGYGHREDQARAFISGFDSHLTKPVQPRALRRALTAIMS